MMKVRFQTLGCKLNFAESSELGKALLQQGHVRALRGEEADLCVLNTCSVTDAADHKGRLAIHRLHRENPNAIIIVTGCYAELKPEEIQQIEGVDFVVGGKDKFAIPELVQMLTEREQMTKSTMAIDIAIPESHGGLSLHSHDDRTRCFLKVQDGCDYYCTYCTIPFARGRSRNNPIAEVVREAEAAIAEGAKELVLTGVNIGDFGKSTGESFIDLLCALDAVEGEVRYRISSCEPNLLSDEIIDFVAQSRHFAPHFHIPLQSGSNEVLRIMHRRYTRELFAERIQHIKHVMPNAFIGVDCMVGVRGETAEYFDDYVQFISSLPVSQLHVFTYSERANTHMLRMDLCVVPQSERKRRSDILHKVSEDKLKTFYHEHRGEQATVLWEGKASKSELAEIKALYPDNPCEVWMSGFTENYIRVFRPYEKQKINTYERITI